MCANMIDLKKVMTRNMELEEELKSTRDVHEEEIVVLLEKNEDLKKKLGVFMGDPRQEEMTTIPRTTSSSMTPTSTPTVVMMITMRSWSGYHGVFHRSKFLVDHHIIS